LAFTLPPHCSRIYDIVAAHLTHCLLFVSPAAVACRYHYSFHRCYCRSRPSLQASAPPLALVNKKVYTSLAAAAATANSLLCFQTTPRCLRIGRRPWSIFLPVHSQPLPRVVFHEDNVATFTRLPVNAVIARPDDAIVFPSSPTKTPAAPYAVAVTSHGTIYRIQRRATRLAAKSS